ncbi:MAG: hypothetical protein M3Q30_17930 [Actinomycetota bacterium]|nr:hypothetical protein [Actinomycetota bacterium]
MSEIVKVEVLGEIGDRGSGVGPVAVDGALAQYLGAFPGEEVVVPSWRREVGEVDLELGDEERGERDGANAGFGLGGAHNECAVVELDLLLVDAKGSVEEVDVAAFETEELASA